MSPLSRVELAPVQASSVVTLVYERLRALILEEDLPAGTRLGQVELAERLGVSRTPVREALRRLTGEGLVDFADQRGFRVAELALEDVVRRLEVRLLLEPGAARLAAERATPADLEALAATIAAQRRARTALGVHDASRAFHVRVAAATQNPVIRTTFESLWLEEVGRRLLASRRAAQDWQEADADDHEAILEALRLGDAERAATLMEAHVRGALQHWEPALERRREAIAR